MAKIILGPIVESVRGKVGSVTFRRIGARDYLSPTARPKLYRQPRQSTNRYILPEVARAWRELSARDARFWSIVWSRADLRHPITGRRFTSARHLFIAYQTMRAHCMADPLILPLPQFPLFTPMLTASLWDIGGYSASPPFGLFQLILPNGSLARYKALFARIGPVTNRLRDYVRVYPQQDSWVDAGLVHNIDYDLFRTLGYLPGAENFFTMIPQNLPTYSYFAYGLDDQGRIYSYTPAAATVGEYVRPDLDPPYSGDP